MVKHTQAIRRQQPKNCLSVFDNFVKLALKGLIGNKVFGYRPLKGTRYSNFMVYSMKKQFVKTISTIMRQINRYKWYNNKYSYFFLWAWSINVVLSTTMIFLSLSTWIKKVIAGVEINSTLRIKQWHVKKSHKNYPELSVKSNKHKYESIAGVESELLHEYF